MTQALTNMLSRLEQIANKAVPHDYSSDADYDCGMKDGAAMLQSYIEEILFLYEAEGGKL